MASSGWNTKIHKRKRDPHIVLQDIRDQFNQLDQIPLENRNKRLAILQIAVEELRTDVAENNQPDAPFSESLSALAETIKKKCDALEIKQPSLSTQTITSFLKEFQSEEKIMAVSDRKKNVNPQDILKAMWVDFKKIKDNLSSDNIKKLSVIKAGIVKLNRLIAAENQTDFSLVGSLFELSDAVNALETTELKLRNPSTQTITSSLKGLKLTPLTKVELEPSSLIDRSIKTGDLSLLKKISREDLLSFMDSKGNNALHLVLKTPSVNSRSSMIAYLLSIAPELLKRVNKKKETPLFMACKRGDWDMIKYLEENAGPYFTDSINENVLKCFAVVYRAQRSKKQQEAALLSSETASMPESSSLSSSSSSSSSSCSTSTMGSSSHSEIANPDVHRLPSPLSTLRR